MSKIRLDQYLALFLLAVVLLLSFAQEKRPITSEASPPELVEMAAAPVNKSNDADELVAFTATLSAEAVTVVDLDSAAILLTKNQDQRLAPASTTKIMTALVARELYSLDQVLTVPAELSVIGHTIGFTAGQEFLAEELFKALLINSGNDAAVVLAANHPQGLSGFVEAMKQKAQELGLKKTSFVNPSGLDAAAHYTTAFELSLLARELMKDEFLRELVKTETAEISDITGQSHYYLDNTNQQLGKELGVVGIKTGTTNLAGQALVTQVNRLADGEERSVLIVLLGSQDRYLDAKAIIDWIFSHYQWREISVR